MSIASNSRFQKNDSLINYFEEYCLILTKQPQKNITVHTTKSQNKEEKKEIKLNNYRIISSKMIPRASM